MYLIYLVGHKDKIVLIIAANGKARITPHIPQMLPNIVIEIRIAREFRFKAPENSIGVIT